MNDANAVKRHTLSVLVENAAGVLSQVSRLFSRKGYNPASVIGQDKPSVLFQLQFPGRGHHRRSGDLPHHH